MLPIISRRRVKTLQKHPGITMFCLAIGVTSAMAIGIVVLLLLMGSNKVLPVKVNNTQTLPEWPLIHIVNTRFMQEQANLTALSLARLHLFQTFCLPTMIHQSTSNFLWIIKTDPLLSLPILQVLVRLLAPYPNFYLVGSNVNFLVPDKGGVGSHGSWRDGEEGRQLLHEAVVYTGNRTLLELAHVWRAHFIVLETRLDADDGLHSRYLEYIQQTASDKLSVPPTITLPPPPQKDPPLPTVHKKPLQWLYWCTRRHIEWHATDKKDNGAPEPDQLSPAVLTDGWVNPMEHSKLCVTPGITIGFAVGVKAADVPIYDHDKIYKELAKRGGCHQKTASTTTTTSFALRNQPSTATTTSSFPDETDAEKLACLHWVEKSIKFAAIRSRTLTSAGMLNVATSEASNKNNDLVQQLWRYLETDFYLDRSHVEQTQRHLQEHALEIAIDNLRGQCTSGHSCKQTAKDELLQLIRLKKQQQEPQAKSMDKDAEGLVV